VCRWAIDNGMRRMSFTRLSVEHERILIRTQAWRPYKNPSNMTQFRDQFEAKTGDSNHLSEWCLQLFPAREHTNAPLY
jgi:hypothetical protein